MIVNNNNINMKFDRKIEQLEQKIKSLNSIVLFSIFLLCILLFCGIH